jgi:hypothetical protein
MSILENVKEVADLAKKIGDVDLYRKILALEGEVQDLTRAKRQLEMKVEEQERIIQLKKDLKFRPPFHWLEGDDTPFCSACWERKEPLAVHVVFSHDTIWETRWDCPTCKNMYVIRKDGPKPEHQGYSTPSGEDGWMAR